MSDRAVAPRVRRDTNGAPLLLVIIGIGATPQFQKAAKALGLGPNPGASSEAICYAVEELRTRRSISAWMQIDEGRFNKEEINRLYDEMVILYARL